MMPCRVSTLPVRSLRRPVIGSTIPPASSFRPHLLTRALHSSSPFSPHAASTAHRADTTNSSATRTNAASSQVAPHRRFNTSSNAHAPSLVTLPPGVPVLPVYELTPTPNSRFWPVTTTKRNASSSFDVQQTNLAQGRQFSSLLRQQLNEYAREPQKSVTLRQLLEVGSHPTKQALLESAQFCYKELPIRLARRVKELENLPYGLSQLEPVIKVRGWYETSFRDLLSHPLPTTEAEELSFTAMLEMIYERHTDVVPTLAKGVLQMKKELGDSGTDVVNQCPFLQDFLNRFHASRIGIRLLISQHVALHTPMDGFIGVFATNLSPMSVIRDAISDASRVCEREYGWAPGVNLSGDESVIFNFVPNHLHHIMFELVKNSMRAVLEFHGPKNYDAPEIEIILTSDDERYAIKVSDQGGGIPRQDMPRIWSYLYTTTNPTSTQDLLNQVTGVDAAGGHPTNAVGPVGDATPMSGFGYGLPMSRLFSSYFGGDINVVSMEGYGTDAFVFLEKLGDYGLFVE